MRIALAIIFFGLVALPTSYAKETDCETQYQVAIRQWSEGIAVIAELPDGQPVMFVTSHLSSHLRLIEELTRTHQSIRSIWAGEISVDFATGKIHNFVPKTGTFYQHDGREIDLSEIPGLDLSRPIRVRVDLSRRLVDQFARSSRLIDPDYHVEPYRNQNLFEDFRHEFQNKVQALYSLVGLMSRGRKLSPELINATVDQLLGGLDALEEILESSRNKPTESNTEGSIEQIIHRFIFWLERLDDSGESPEPGEFDSRMQTLNRWSSNIPLNFGEGSVSQQRIDQILANPVILNRATPHELFTVIGDFLLRETTVARVYQFPAKP